MLHVVQAISQCNIVVPAALQASLEVEHLMATALMNFLEHTLTYDAHALEIFALDTLVVCRISFYLAQ